MFKLDINALTTFAFIFTKSRLTIEATILFIAKLFVVIKVAILFIDKFFAIQAKSILINSSFNSIEILSSFTQIIWII